MSRPDRQRPDDEARPCCFGFAVDTTLELLLARHGPGVDGSRLRVLAGDAAPGPGEPADPLIAWDRTPDRPVGAAVYPAVDGAHRLHIDGGGWFRVDPQAGEVTVPADAEPLRREERLWGLPAGLCFIARGDLPLHAAAVDVGGRAVLLAAPTRHGKTTLAAAFAAAGFALLTEDLACLRLGPPVTVLPGPRSLRVRHDVADRLPVPAARVLGRDDDRLHLGLPDGSEGAAPRPVSAVVLLRGWADRVVLRQSTGAGLLPDLWALSLHLPTDEGRARCFAGVAALADAVPVLDLHRPHGIDALPRVVDGVVEGLRHV